MGGTKRVKFSDIIPSTDEELDIASQSVASVRKVIKKVKKAKKSKKEPKPNLRNSKSVTDKNSFRSETSSSTTVQLLRELFAS